MYIFLTVKMYSRNILLIIIVLGFFLRLVNFQLPHLSADEAAVAARGYYLSQNGKDELGRSFPVIFNSIGDYRLPLTSYITAVGERILGKNDLGARFPFLVIGTLLIWLTYLIASVFNPMEKFKLMTALMVAFSPSLIFLSKIPNETIVLVFLFSLLFFLLTKKKLNIYLTTFVFLLLLLTSKTAWFVLFPFTLFTLFIFKNSFPTKNKLLVVASLLLSGCCFLIWLKIPQGNRSLMENNFSLFSNISIENGINRLRGQGIMSGWPSFLDKILFNKTDYIFTGFLNWLSDLGPATFFGQFDPNGIQGFWDLGAWSKVLIIPLIFSLGKLIRKIDKKFLSLPGYFLVLTFPAFFIFPGGSSDLAVLVLPFMAILLAYGLSNMTKVVASVIILIMMFEVLVNLFLVSPQVKKTNNLRPGWVRQIVLEGYRDSKNNKVAFSDDITNGLDAFIEWYTPAVIFDDSGIAFPYKFRQYSFSSISLIGNDSKFYNCGFDKPVVIFASRRDLNKIQKEFPVSVETTFRDDINNSVVYKLHPGVCIHES